MHLGCLFDNCQLYRSGASDHRPRLTQLREHLSARFELVGSSSSPTSNQGGKIMLVVIWDTVSARMLPSLGGDVGLVSLFLK